jgi:hypothetical protein
VHERGSCFPCTRTPEATGLLQYSIHKALQDWDADLFNHYETKEKR